MSDSEDAAAEAMPPQSPQPSRPEPPRRERSPLHPGAVRFLSGALSVVIALSLFGGLSMLWLESAVFDGDGFANRTTRLLESSEVREALATEIVDELVENGASQLIPYRSVVISIAADLAGTPAFRSVFRQALLQAHRTVFTEDGASAAVNLSGAVAILTASLKISNPDIAAQIPPDVGQVVIDATDQVRQLELWTAAEELSSTAGALLAVAVVASVALLYLLPTRRAAVVRIGAVVAVTGAAIVVTGLLVPRVMSDRIANPSLSRAVEAGLEVFVGDLRMLGLWTLAAGVVGLALATAGAPTAEPVNPRTALAWLQALARGWQPATDAGRVVRAVVVIAVGVIVVVQRDLVLDLVALVTGACIVYLGVVQLLVVVGRRPGTDAARGGAPVLGGQPEDERRWRRRRTVWLGATGVALVGVVVLMGWHGVQEARRHAVASVATVCNGSRDLCAKRIDEVAFPASHNSMSAAASPGWIFAQNRRGIAEQLQYGIRGFLVKTHYGLPSGITLTGADLVVTDRAAEVAVNPAAANEQLPAGAVDRANALAATAGRITAPRGLYLCHVYCELGAQPIADALAELKAFLDRNPDEVLFFVSGDYVAVDDTARAFREAGLADRLWEYRAGDPPPTLQQMIDAKRPIFYLAENSGPPPAWNNPAYGPAGILQDTPFTFTAPWQLEGSAIAASCARNRGTPDSPLFQINHWITNGDPPSIDDARVVNAYDVLMPRVRGCMDERGRFPTLIGVNFYDQGDLLRVVDELNGVEPPGVR